MKLKKTQRAGKSFVVGCDRSFGSESCSAIELAPLCDVDFCRCFGSGQPVFGGLSSLRKKDQTVQWDLPSLRQAVERGSF